MHSLGRAFDLHTSHAIAVCRNITYKMGVDVQRDFMRGFNMLLMYLQDTSLCHNVAMERKISVVIRAQEIQSQPCRSWVLLVGLGTACSLLRIVKQFSRA